MTRHWPGQLIMGHPASKPSVTLYGTVLGIADLRRGPVVYVEWDSPRPGEVYMHDTRWRDTLVPSAVAVVQP